MLLFGYDTMFPALFVPIIVGLFVVLTARSRNEALALGAIAGFAGSTIATALYDKQTVALLLRDLPAYANENITQNLYMNFIVPLTRADPVNTFFTGGGALVFVVAATALAAGTALAVAEIGRRRHDVAAFRRVAGWIAIALVAASFLYTGWTTSGWLRQRLATDPQPKTYAFDPVINLKAYYLMLGGQDYYTAIVAAAQGDTRLVAGRDIIGGKFAGWGGSVPLRQPEIWYVWKFIAPTGGAGIFVWALLLAAGYLVAAYLALSKVLSYRALFVSMAIYPALMMHTAWQNVLHPDWWATLAVLFSMLFVVRKRPVAAGVLALVAALFREVLVVWLLILVAVALYQTIRDRALWKVLATLVVLLLVFAVAYALHYQKTQQYVYHGAELATKGGLAQSLSLLAALTRSSIQAKIVAPTGYLMFPYGGFKIPPWIFLPLGIVGLYVALRKDRVSAMTVAAWPAFWLAFYLIFAPTSTYWGMHVMPVSIAGTAMLLVSLDRVRWIAGREGA